MACAGGNFGDRRGAIEMTVEELERPAKELPLEVLKQIGIQLVSQRGNWVSLAEVLGYNREQIDEFETQSNIIKQSAGYLVLKDWTKEEDGRSLFVLRESLLQCGRVDCVTYLEQQIKDAMSMNLILKIVDEDSNSRHFMSVRTLCHATLKDSIQNVLNYGTRTHDYKISEAWTERAWKFKGRHLTVRRRKRISPESSMFENEGVSLHRAGSPYNDLSCDPVRLPTSQLNISKEDDVSREKSNIFEGEDAKKSLIIRQYYISDECVNCGRFRTSSQSSRPDSTVQSSMKCANCNCNEENVEQIKSTHFVDKKPVSDNHVSSSCTSMDCSTQDSSHDYYNETFLKRKQVPQNVDKVHLNSEKDHLKQQQVTYTSHFQFPVKFGTHFLQNSYQPVHEIPRFHNMDHRNITPVDRALDVHGLSAIGVNHFDSPVEISLQRGMLTDNYTQTSLCVLPDPSKQINARLKSTESDQDDVEFHETFVKTPFDEEVEVMSNEMTLHQRERSISEPAEMYQQLILNRKNADGQLMMGFKSLVQPMQTFPADTDNHNHRQTTIADAFSTLQRTTQSSVQRTPDRNILQETQIECSLSHSLDFDMDTTELKYTSDHSSGSDVNQVQFSSQTDCIPPTDRRYIVEHGGNQSPVMTRTVCETRISPNDVKSGQEPEVPSRQKHPPPPRLPPPRAADEQGTSNLMKLLKGSKFKYINQMLSKYPGWCPKENEKTVEKTMSKYQRASGYYTIWFMKESQTLVLTVSHIGKLIHYGIHMRSVNNQIVFYIFDGENFADLTDLLQYYTQHGLKSQQSATYDKIQSRIRLSHVQLRYPVTSSKHCRPSV